MTLVYLKKKNHNPLDAFYNTRLQASNIHNQVYFQEEKKEAKNSHLLFGCSMFFKSNGRFLQKIQSHLKAHGRKSKPFAILPPKDNLCEHFGVQVVYPWKAGVHECVCTHTYIFY